MAMLVTATHALGIDLVYALAPGLDICFSRTTELDRVVARLTQLVGFGCNQFALLFDDIPTHWAHDEDARHYASQAHAQAALCNAVLHRLRGAQPECRLIVCPTGATGRVVRRPPYRRCAALMRAARVLQ